VARAGLEQWFRATGRTAPTVLVLGVTPELCRLAMTGNSRVVAVDKSTEMIRANWLGFGRPQNEAICADWRQTPLAAGSVDIVLADGSLSMLPYPSGYLALLAELRRLLRPQGRFLTRCFAQRENRESIEEVWESLSRGSIGSFHVLKWRVAMALQPDARAGVAVGSVWEAIHSAWNDLDQLATRLVWPIEEVSTLEVYRNVDTRYTFPTVAQYRELFRKTGWSVLQTVVPSYELGERCPHFALEMQSAARLDHE
jgi:SAM-dependent methyltransferase